MILVQRIEGFDGLILLRLIDVDQCLLQNFKINHNVFTFSPFSRGKKILAQRISGFDGLILLRMIDVAQCLLQNFKKD